MPFKQTTLRNIRKSPRDPPPIDYAPLAKKEQLTAAAKRPRRLRPTYQKSYLFNYDIDDDESGVDEVKDNKGGLDSIERYMRRGKEKPHISDTIALKPSAQSECERLGDGDGKVVRNRKRKRRRVEDDSDAEEAIVEVVDGDDTRRGSSATDSTRTMLDSKTCNSKTCIPNSEDEDMESSGESEFVEERKSASSPQPPLSSSYSVTFHGNSSLSSSRQTSPIERKRRRSVKETPLTERSTPLTPTSTPQTPCLRISLVGCDDGIFAVPISEIPSPPDLKLKLTKIFKQPPDSCLILKNDRGDIIDEQFWEGRIWGDGCRMKVEFPSTKSRSPSLPTTEASCGTASEDTAKVKMVDAIVQTEEEWSKMREAIEADVRAKWKEKVKELEMQLEEGRARERATMQRLREQEKEREKSCDLELHLSQTNLSLCEAKKKPEPFLDPLPHPGPTPSTPCTLTRKPRARDTPLISTPSRYSGTGSASPTSPTPKNRTSTPIAVIQTEAFPPAMNVKDSYQRPGSREADDWGSDGLDLDLSWDDSKVGVTTTTTKASASHETNGVIASSKPTTALETHDKATGGVSNNLSGGGYQVNGESRAIPGKWYMQKSKPAAK